MVTPGQMAQTRWRFEPDLDDFGGRQDGARRQRLLEGEGAASSHAAGASVLDAFTAKPS